MKCCRCGKEMFSGAVHVRDQRTMRKQLKDRRDYWMSAAESGMDGTRRLAARMVEELTRAINELAAMGK